MPQSALARDTVATAPEATQAELAAALTSYLSDKKGRFSVTVTELDGEQRTISLNGGRRVEPASTIKLFYAWAALRAVDDGTLTMASRLGSGLTVSRCLTLMLQLSDNLCSVDFRLKLGAKKLNTLFASEGYIDTYIVLDSKGRYVTKRTSSDDLALLLARLETGALLSEEQTNEFTKRLLAQIWRHRISSGVAVGTVVASKSGELWVPSGMVEADTGIIHGAHSTYVLTAVGTHGASSITIRGISSIVYRYLQGKFDHRASFPSHQFVTAKKVKLRTSPGGHVIKSVAKGTTVQVLYSARNWMRVKTGSRYGWMQFQELALRKAYLWKAPVVTGDVAATGAPCTVVGTGGDDDLIGTPGSDVICGLGGDDTIDGDGGADTVDGGPGDDLLLGGAGADYLIGGTGIDTVSYAYLADSSTPVTADLDGIRDDGPVGEQDRIRADVENLIGSPGDDTLIGNAGDNTLEGGLGHDSVDGGDGTDTCVFSAGDPVIDDAVNCEQNAVRLDEPLTDLAEPLQAYSDTDPARCLTNNCGVTAADYCFVSDVSGLVDDCAVWDGWGDGWWEGMVTPAGPYFPEEDWVIVDRSKLPDWATFVENPGAYLFSPN